MNAQNLDNKPKIKKESKNKIKVEFDRTPLKERLKAKFLSVFFLQKALWTIFRLVLLIGISYIVLFPFFSKIAGSFMAPEDFVDVTVRLIPKHFSLDIYKGIILELKYFEAFKNTLVLSGSTALIQTFVCSFVAYGLAKFKFKGNKLVFFMVIFSLIVPHQTLKLSLYQSFQKFDILGIAQLLSGDGITILGFPIFNNGFLSSINLIPADLMPRGGGGINLTETYWPLLILSACGLAFKNGLYIFMLRQFFKGVPDELEESAYIDGSGVFYTFFKIILPLSVPMMITVFLFAFSWQWTDDFYIPLFMSRSKTVLMSNYMGIPPSLSTGYAGKNMYDAAIKNTCGLLIILPLVIMYLFCQKHLVQGIERSGLTAD